MHIKDIYLINISSELLMIAILIFLLITCLVQRKQQVTTMPLNILIITNLLLMMCQIAEWTLMLASGAQFGMPAFRTWKELAYSLDYILGYFSSVAFYYYVRAHIRDLYADRELAVPDIRFNMLRFLIVWGAAASGLYAFCMTREWFYFLQPNGSEMFHRGAYLCFYLLAMVATAVTVAALVRHRRILGRLSFVLLLFYKLSPAALLIPDLLNSTCLSYVMRGFYTFILYVHIDQRREKQLVIQARELQELRTQIMLSQIQPHFLYNTLTTISGLCSLGDPARAREVVDKFAVYFRQNMDALGKSRFIPFEKELEHIQTYLWIEKVRFDEDLHVEYKIGPTNFRLPSLSLQPLVENAVKHGICQKPDSGTVTVETRETADEFLIIVADDGVGFDPNAIPDDGRSHVGIENIQLRLEVLSKGRLELQSTIGKGTVATVHLPKKESILP